jgi:hypothetical protein
MRIGLWFSNILHYKKRVNSLKVIILLHLKAIIKRINGKAIGLKPNGMMNMTKSD